MMQADNSNARMSVRPSMAAYAMIAAMVACIFIPLLFFKAVRIGDGSEYYALYLTIKSEGRPWMTTGAFKLYDELFRSGAIEALFSTDSLRDSFPALRLGATADFNHFWAYSAIAAMVSKGMGLIGATVSAHQAFLLQHAGLFLAAAWLALALFGKRGFFVAITLTIASPIVWFLDKVHTEFFSYCLILGAVMLAQRRFYLWGALCLAVASTQNPSFALLAFVLLVLRLCEVPNRPFRFWEAAALVATCIIVLAHPAYYFFRFGTPTPQMLAGGAKIGANASKFYIWLIDPDVGLLPNWPLGIAILALGLVSIFSRCTPRLDKKFLFFLASYLFVNLFAHSSTLNINSGGTPGLARYALWYIPIFFPVALAAVDFILSKPSIAQWVCGSLVVCYAAANVYLYDPRRPESYTIPSPVSAVIQRKLPGLYNPPPEVFAERYSGYGDGLQSHSLTAILGPSCDKLLVTPGRDPTLIAWPSRCVVDTDKLKAYAGDALQTSKVARYVRIANFARDLGLNASGTYLTQVGRSGVNLLGGGWHAPESWGVWSAQTSAQVSVPCVKTDTSEGFKLALSLSGFVTERRRETAVRVRSQQETIWSGMVGGSPVEAAFELKRAACSSNNMALLTVDVDFLSSPKDNGASDDARKLGIGLRSIYYP